MKISQVKVRSLVDSLSVAASRSDRLSPPQAPRYAPCINKNMVGLKPLVNFHRTYKLGDRIYCTDQLERSSVMLNERANHQQCLKYRSVITASSTLMTTIWSASLAPLDQMQTPAQNSDQTLNTRTGASKTFLACSNGVVRTMSHFTIPVKHPTTNSYGSQKVHRTTLGS